MEPIQTGAPVRRAAAVVVVAGLIGALALSFVLVPSAGAAPSVPVATPAQRAEAILKPSVVFIVTKWTGFLMNGELAQALSSDGNSAPKIEATTTCSGFIANPSGYVVTAAHCVDDKSAQFGGKGVIIDTAVAEAVNRGLLSAADAPSVITYGYENWKIEGTEAGSNPDRVVGVYLTKAASSITVSTPLQANVVDFQSFDHGDVALLKVESKTPLPAVQVAGDSASSGTPIAAAGFPGSVLDTVDPNTSEPSFKDGTVSGARTVSGVPFTEISAATSSGMSGGPVVDMRGMVYGTVSWTPGAESQPFNFITATSAIRDLMSSHTVSNTLSPTDVTYRAGLDDYFAGKYHSAAKKFDQVLAVEPDHAQAQEYKRLAVTNYPNEKSSGSSTTLIIGIVAGVVVLLGAGGLLLFSRRRRSRPVEPAPAGATVTGFGAAPSMGPTAVAPQYAVPTPLTEPVPPASPAAPAPPAAPAAPVEPATHTALFCPNCGEPHEAGAHFCASCGTRFPAPVGSSDQ